MEFKEELVKELKSAERIAILGVGNELRRDDAAGVAFTKLFKPMASKNVLVLNCGMTPENFIDKVRRFRPSHVIYVDAVEASNLPGSIGVFNEGNISTATVSTHRISLALLISYMRALGVKAKVIVLGVQPKDLSLGEGLSPEVQEAVNLLATLFKDALAKR